MRHEGIVVVAVRRSTQAPAPKHYSRSSSNAYRTLRSVSPARMPPQALDRSCHVSIGPAAKLARVAKLRKKSRAVCFSLPPALLSSTPSPPPRPPFLYLTRRLQDG